MRPTIVTPHNLTQPKLDTVALVAKEHYVIRMIDFMGSSLRHSKKINEYLCFYNAGS